MSNKPKMSKENCSSIMYSAFFSIVVMLFTKTTVLNIIVCFNVRLTLFESLDCWMGIRDNLDSLDNWDSSFSNEGFNQYSYGIRK